MEEMDKDVKAKKAECKLCGKEFNRFGPVSVGAGQTLCADRYIRTNLPLDISFYSLKIHSKLLVMIHAVPGIETWSLMGGGGYIS